MNELTHIMDLGMIELEINQELGRVERENTQEHNERDRGYYACIFLDQPCALSSK